MLQAVAEAHCIDEHVLHVTTSIGVSVYPDDGTEAESLIRNADTAMYQAKEDGRHGFRFFTPEMNARAVESLSMEAVHSQSISRHFSVALAIRPRRHTRRVRCRGSAR